ncbi:ATP-binding cassette domain-containing protein [Amylibacter sp. SFDW26]|uniref:ABC-F family ATP-binding cassette domain-containing protein n=1 Tax=Amylibacter sp. SFDW26 TaxID=2652722 RepID=UPI001262783C|nr:ATP-binding cassette domain-containing protein [Amylibacter sp. SFDW26]KAB7615693.1 ATP-binding cassette domain-containing protein [Amylibacter sp. SFDW26]
MAAPPILTLSDIRLGFGGNPLFTGLDLVISEGARLCLVGRNGSGKSTLLKVIAGLVQADEGERFLRPRQSVGYMEQDPDLSGYETLRDYAMTSLDAADAYRVDMVAEGLKLDLDRAPDTASGGERRRAALTKIVAEDPDLMLLDEPTNHLDVEAIAWLEDHLRTTRKAFVLISHDRTFLRTLTKGIIWVDRGLVRQHPKGFEAFEDWRDKMFDEEDQQRHKLNRLIKAEGRWAVEGISARRKRNQGRVRRLADLRAEKAGQIKRTGTAAMALDTGPKSGKLVVEAIGVSKAYDKPIVQNFDLRVMRGERIALVGPNGVGKTTLLNILTGQTEPDSGTIKLGTNLVSAIFDQNRAQLDPTASLWDTLTMDKELGVSGKNDQIMVRGNPKHVVGYLKEFLFDDNQARGPVSALSGGEKARLLLARIMAKPSNLLILDEPTNDLDVETLDLLQEILDGYDGSVILVSHDRDFLDLVATTTIAMEGDGNATVYAGGWSDYRSQRKEILGQVAKAPKKAKKTDAKGVAELDQSGLNFTQKHRLEELPSVMERLEAEIAKLQEFMSDPELFTKEPIKFQKATDALIERQAALDAAEEEWLELEALAEET